MIIYYCENYTEDPLSNAARVSALFSIVAALHYLCVCTRLPQLKT